MSFFTGMSTLTKILLGVVGVTGAAAVLDRKPEAKPVEPPPFGARVVAGDEVVVPRSAVASLPQLPANAGGAIVAVVSTTPATIQGFVVAFVGSGGTVDVDTPIGPIDVPRSAVSTVVIVPPDRVGRFAKVGDDVTVPASGTVGASGLAVRREDVDPQNFSGMRPEDNIDSVTVRVEGFESFRNAQGVLEPAITGTVREFSFSGPGRSGGGRSLPVGIETPRVAVTKVVRNGSLIAATGPGGTDVAMFNVPGAPPPPLPQAPAPSGPVRPPPPPFPQAPAPSGPVRMFEENLPVVPGGRYQVAVRLSGLPKLLANEQRVANETRKQGFTDVAVTRTRPANPPLAEGDFYIAGTFTGPPRAFGRSQANGGVRVTDAWRTG